jgi:hypothetical protein
LCWRLRVYINMINVTRMTYCNVIIYINCSSASSVHRFENYYELTTFLTRKYLRYKCDFCNILYHHRFYNNAILSIYLIFKYTSFNVLIIIDISIYAFLLRKSYCNGMTQYLHTTATSILYELFIVIP